MVRIRELVASLLVCGEGTGGSEDDDHVGWEKVWHDLGEKELIDCRKHHQKMGQHGNALWHGPGARIQNTWGPPIRLLLSFKNPPLSQERRRYATTKEPAGEPKMEKRWWLK